MKKYLLLIPLAFSLLSCGTKPAAPTSQSASSTSGSPAVVYMSHHVSDASLVAVYQALGVQPQGRVAVKISTGESGGNYYLKPELIGSLVRLVNGTIVECNCVYPGKRDVSEEHWQTIRDHGFLDIAPVDIMDEEGDLQIPVRDSSHIPYNLVGSHLANYDFMINLAHFKGHPMAGYGGVIKNQSIGVSSANGKALIHTAGSRQDKDHKLSVWSNAVASTKQDHFLESMAAAAQSVADYMHGNIIYINVMNNLSVDCDCVPHGKAPQLQDVGILASTDPVALDQACLDIIFRMEATPGNNPEPLQKRIRSRNGTHTVDYAETIGLGTKNYTIVHID